VTFDTVSLHNLQGLNPDLVLKAQKAADALAEQGIWFRVYSGLRTAQQQNDLYAQGRNGDPRPIVTKAKAGESNHNYGCAFDAVPFVSGQSGPLNGIPAMVDQAQFDTFVTALKAAGLAWGGDWKTFKDMDHFYILEANPTPAMISMYQQGKPLDAIWASLESENA
jgi:peptidoglycan LD-endopeptidase CwlK